MFSLAGEQSAAHSFELIEVPRQRRGSNTRHTTTEQKKPFRGHLNKHPGEPEPIKITPNRQEEPKPQASAGEGIYVRVCAQRKQLVASLDVFCAWR